MQDVQQCLALHKEWRSFVVVVFVVVVLLLFFEQYHCPEKEMHPLLLGFLLTSLVNAGCYW